MQIILPPDAEALLVGALRPLLGVAVATEIPPDRLTSPSEFVKVSVTDGNAVDYVITNFDVAFEAWGPDSVAASFLARKAFGVINALEGQAIGGTYVYSAAARIPRNFPDPRTRNPRYLFTAALSLRANPLTI